MLNKPKKTAADFLVIALSPALIMALVGSLCFFLVEVFYRGSMGGSVRWVLFWFVIGIVLVSRIAIEQSAEHAALYGLGLAFAVWVYCARMSSSDFFNLFLLAIVWFCANKLVWDCTLIDDDLDASGQGLLQKSPPENEAEPKDKKKRKRTPSSSPGRWVIFFSLAALPLFGIGQLLLPAGDTHSHRLGLTFLIIYMAAALGLLITTSFLGLRRYLRQRYLRMPPSIALAWVKFGAGVALLILIGALFIPRPGEHVFLKAVRQQVDHRLHQASEYAARQNPHGEGEGRTGNDTGPTRNKGEAEANSGPRKENSSGTPEPSNGPPGPKPKPSPMDPSMHMYRLLRSVLLITAALIAGWWLVRCRYLLWEILRSCAAAIRDFFRELLDLIPARKPIKPEGPQAPTKKRRPLAEFKNPFYAGKEYSRPPEEIILYTYDALQSWTREHGIETRPEHTAREFCEQTSQQLPELTTALRQLSYLYAHVAYGEHLPPDCNLEPLAEIWRRITLN